MAATPYDVTPTEQPSAPAERRPRQIVVNMGQFGGKLAIAIVAVGLLVIGFGWNGAAGTPNFIAQMPYLLSGGFLGLGIVAVGAALMVTQSHREDRARLEAKLDELVEALARGQAATAATLQAPATAADLVAVGAASYHRPDCRLVEGRDDSTLLTVDEASARGLVACRVCKPAGVEARVSR